MLQNLFNIAEFTRRNIFLTGKAGTGKTTFLNDFTKKTNKKYIIVAPTGIAAINAGGVTIHSMFGLPLTTFVPTTEYVDLNECINIPQLLPHFKYRKDKLKLLRTLEILIIDEVSMLRADLLDMIDWALKSARRSTQPFGGVQLLLVGDLYQLPPVVKPESERILGDYYNAPYFFESKALTATDYITVELTTVYRQSDAAFISILNAIRNGEINDIDFDALNHRYDPGFEPRDSYVYLVTHNYLADAINSRKLEALPGKKSMFRAIITGDFKEHLYPNDPELLLKPQAQVMFIRNDASEEKRYYNGLLATITRIGEDSITVITDTTQKEITVERELWENKRYHLDENREIKMEVAGSYEQFPFRLAWAVTIHKSQGLTFDKVIIDAGKSFTSGQVYVALSRCRTLEGIILKSPIQAGNILRDNRINEFHQKTNVAEIIGDIYEREKNDFAISKLLQNINPASLTAGLEDWIKEGAKSSLINKEKFSTLSDQIGIASTELEQTFAKFERFVNMQVREPGSWTLIENKSAGAVQYFLEQVQSRMYQPLFEFYSTTKSAKGLKGYNTVLRAFLEDIKEYLVNIQSLHLLDKKLYTGQKEIPRAEEVSKQPSHLLSWQLLEEGKTPDQIAAERNLTVGTVYGHFAKVATTGKLDISKLFPENRIMRFLQKLETSKWNSLGEVKSALPDFEFHELRVLLNHYATTSKDPA
ncbi:MAG: helix-turn-helix domain-containing protein [Chitinophagaceae bacterium]|nr:helix-turn-helix domain-containing protein [Chitinophagaceae bacterium]MCW5927380.1 helix-turn-helix domain-containing protein [Chitinophagaceae bacterium]